MLTNFVRHFCSGNQTVMDTTSTTGGSGGPAGSISSVIVPFCLLAALMAIYYWTWTRSRIVRLVNAIPGPKALPLLGNFLQLNVGHDAFLKRVHFEWMQQYGRIYRAWGGMRPVVIVCTPELMEPILVSQKLITKAVEYSYLSPWLGNCMFLTTGTRWKTRRRLLTPAFHFQILNSFVDVFNEQSLVCARQLEMALETSKDGQLDIFPFMTECALDIICGNSISSLRLFLFVCFFSA